MLQKLKKHSKKFQRTAKNSILEGAYLVTRMLVLLIATRLIILKYDVIGFGYYSFWFSVIGYINILVDFGINLTGVREIGQLISAKNHKDVSKFYYSAFIIRMIPALFLSILTFPLLITHSINSIEAITLFSGILMGVLESTWFMQAFDEYTLRTIFNISVRILFLAIVFYIPSSWNVLWILIIRNLSIILKDLFSFILIEIKYKLRQLPNLKYIRSVLKTTTHNYITLILSAGYRQTYPLLLKFFITPYAYGIFSAVYRMLSLVGETQLVITRPTFTLFSRKTKNTHFYKLGTYLTTAVVMLTSIIALSAAYNPIAMHIIYPKIHYSQGLLNLILSASIVGILWSITGHTNIIFMVLKKKDRILTYTMALKILAATIGLFILHYFKQLNIHSLIFFSPLILAELINLTINIISWKKQYKMTFNKQNE